MTDDGYGEQIVAEDVSGLSTDLLIEKIGNLANSAADPKAGEKFQEAIVLSKKAKKRELNDLQRASLNFAVANVWGGLHQLSLSGDADVWNWEQDAVEKQLIHLRQAVNALEKTDPEKHADLSCPVYTNLAATLYHIGRFVEAVEYWDRALAMSSSFSMARGNRGYALIHYAHALYEEVQALILLQHAYQDLKKALINGVEKHARPVFEDHFNDLRRVFPEDGQIDTGDLNTFPEETIEEENTYRAWCASNRLFLNPLNDLGVYAAAQTDVLSTPSIVMKKGDVPLYHGYFNQMKQEFVSARWLFYDGTRDTGNHYSDSNVLMFDTLDHPVYGLAVEKIKLSFRMAYALFDKIAFFLNRYLDLAIEDRKVNFRTFWYQSGKKINGLKTELTGSQNWPLRGLFWLSKDLYEDEPGFKDALEPDARQIHAIRNQLEHQFLKLHDAQWNGSAVESETDASPEASGSSMAVSDFIGTTMKILKMVRAALIYLSLSVHSEEIRRSEERADDAEISVKELPILKRSDA